MIKEIFKLTDKIFIIDDFSHWVCDTESMLENFSEILDESIHRSMKFI